MNKKDRRDLIYKIMKQEKNAYKLAEEFSVSTSYIYQLAKTYKVKLPRKKRDSVTDDILRDLESNSLYTQNQLAKKHNCSQALVSKVAYDNGYRLVSYYKKDI